MRWYVETENIRNTLAHIFSPEDPSSAERSVLYTHSSDEKNDQQRKGELTKAGRGWENCGGGWCFLILNLLLFP